MGFEDIVRQRTSTDLLKESARSATFEDQWAHPTELQFGNERADLYDVKPEEVKRETPLMIVPGWGATPERFKENIRTVVSAGRRALSVDSPHGVSHDIEVPAYMEQVPETELRRIAAFMEGLNVAGVDKTSAVGHSQGGLDLALAAAMYPERFRAIALVDPAGMIGSDTMLPLAARFTWDQIKALIGSARDGTLKERLRITSEATPILMGHPKQSWDQVRTLASANIMQLLGYIKSQGVGIVVIHGVDDAAFPMQRVQGQTEATIREGAGKGLEQRSPERIDKIAEEFLDGFVSVKGTHNDFVVHAPEYTRIAEGLLTAIEDKQDKARAVESNP